MQPSLETLRELVRACGLDLGFRLANYDDSYLRQIDDQLALTPLERLQRSTRDEQTYARLLSGAA